MMEIIYVMWSVVVFVIQIAIIAFISMGVVWAAAELSTYIAQIKWKRNCK